MELELVVVVESSESFETLHNVSKMLQKISKRTNFTQKILLIL